MGGCGQLVILCPTVVRDTAQPSVVQPSLTRVAAVPGWDSVVPEVAQLVGKVVHRVVQHRGRDPWQLGGEQESDTARTTGAVSLPSSLSVGCSYAERTRASSAAIPLNRTYSTPFLCCVGSCRTVSV